MGVWAPILSSSLATLRQLAGATEHEFLRIGGQMQDIYQRSAALSQTAHRLVEVVSGEKIHPLIAQLRRMLHEMETSLEQEQVQNAKSRTLLSSVASLLQRIAEPLEGFKKMCRHLSILEVLIKIESAYLGEMGGEFIHLALDIKKLGQQIKEKAQAIHDHRLQLAAMIARHLIGRCKGCGSVLWWIV